MSSRMLGPVKVVLVVLVAAFLFAAGVPTVGGATALGLAVVFAVVGIVDVLVRR